MFKKLAFCSIVLNFLLISIPSFAQLNSNKFALQVYLGDTYPISAFADDQSNSITWGVDITYKLSPSTDIISSFGYNNFSKQERGLEVQLPIDYYHNIMQGTAGVMQSFNAFKDISVYAKTQAGIYIAKETNLLLLHPGDGPTFTYSGLNAGGGITFKYDNRLSVFAETVYNYVFAPGNVSFVTAQGGLRFEL